MKILETYVRVYVDDMDSALNFYESLWGETSTLRFKHSRAELELGVVGNMLILAGSDPDLEPFRHTQATFKVDTIHEFYDYLLKSGCKVIRGLTRVPTGTNLTVQHPDGTILEYVEHHP